MLNIKKSDIFAVRTYDAKNKKYKNKIYTSLGAAKAVDHYYWLNPSTLTEYYYCIHTYSGQVIYYSVLYGALEYFRNNDLEKYTDALRIIEEQHIEEFLNLNDCN